MNARTSIAVVLLCAAAAAPVPAQQQDPLRVGLGPTVSLGVGGQLRERYELWDGFNFSAPATADHRDGFLLTRALVHGRLTVGAHLGAFVEIKSSMATRRSLLGGQRSGEVDELDVQQAWAELRFGAGARSMLRVGRQDLTLGRERLVSPLDWTNTRRTFEGAQVLLSGPGGNLRAFVVRPVRVIPYQANEGDTLQWIAGVYQTVGRATGRAVDVYYLHNHNRTAAFNGTGGREERSTLGARVYTRGQGRWDYDAEGALQFGSLGGQDIRASMIGAEVGLSVPSLVGTPRFHLGYDYASGDAAAGGRVGTFNQLFPLGHAFLGYIDAHGRQNVVDVSGGADARLFGRSTVAATVHRFWRQNSADGLYGVGGGPAVRAPGNGLSTSVGSELDLTLRWPVRPRMLVQTGYSRYFAGAFIRQSGPHSDIAFGYGSLTVTW